MLVEIHVGQVAYLGFLAVVYDNATHRAQYYSLAYEDEDSALSDARCHCEREGYYVTRIELDEELC